MFSVDMKTLNHKLFEGNGSNNKTGPRNRGAIASSRILELKTSHWLERLCSTDFPTNYIAMCVPLEEVGICWGFMIKKIMQISSYKEKIRLRFFLVLRQSFIFLLKEQIKIVHN